ncbi:hypothetical protein [Mycolicibacterium monacense]|uniref:Uncharacterized protein n=2 Tax=unclassified Mycobacterium TaxID=2642494 RepID=A0A5Q5BGS1_MYCSS|nr:hypothetical protein [Mycolicibacterium monacense]OBF46959.1 hypothetical protein A5778_25840 [Mycolicibacterium monacense]
MRDREFGRSIDVICGQQIGRSPQGDNFRSGGDVPPTSSCPFSTMAAAESAVSSFCRTSGSGTAGLLDLDVGQVLRSDYAGPAHVLVTVQTKFSSDAGRANELDADSTVGQSTPERHGVAGDLSASTNMDQPF